VEWVSYFKKKNNPTPHVTRQAVQPDVSVLHFSKTDFVQSQPLTKRPPISYMCAAFMPQNYFNLILIGVINRKMSHSKANATGRATSSDLNAVRAKYFISNTLKMQCNTLRPTVMQPGFPCPL
jgi:hypothetical protein